ncbi:uncharacterized protein LOC110994862 isoform X2 [Pieris rapae]|uniref:uncharacterized protein LOC110994862 isoform X2 n=1 Tax=Pieris rapae TaxID=64459 RepID=UPI001E27DA44|nr:uncharacterized protein LOC110994862 isoform X2 [Pieris rapae]
MKELLPFLLLTLCVSFSAADASSKGRHFALWGNKEDNAMDVSDFSVYYDLNTNETIRKMLPRPWYKPGWFIRLPFRGGPCECEELKCSCCTGIRIQAFNYDRRTCAIIEYQPEDSIFSMEVRMNNASIFQRIYSARNAPPFCVPVPVPYLPPTLVDMCIRLYDVSVIDQKFHVCMDMDTRIDKAPVLILHWDCMDVGTGGVALSKPGGSGSPSTTSVGISTTPEPTQVDSDVYDPVVQDRGTTTNDLFKNSIKYI